MVNKIITPPSQVDLIDKVNEIVDAKQDTLVSGTNIKTINNQSLLGSGNISIGGGSVATDNKSINTNSSDQLQTIGVIDQNDTTTAIKTWTGTKSQYDAIVTKDHNTLYNITDDTDVSLTILQALYPVGSIYITTANTCPLSELISGSTWELVSSGRVLQGADSGHSAGTTIEAGLPNITGVVGTYAAGATSASTTVDSLYKSGAFTSSYGLSLRTANSSTTSETWCRGACYSFNASDSNSIYGNSTTVQPPAYFVNIFRRTA